MDRLLFLCALVALAQGGLLNRSNKDEHKEITLLKANKHSIVLRAPTSMGQFFRRVLGKEKSTYVPSQAVHAAAARSSFTGNNAYGSAGSPSAFYPSYSPHPFAPGIAGQIAAASIARQSYLPLASSPYNPSAIFAPSSFAPAASPGAHFAASYSNPVIAPPAPASPNFPSVLDSYVRTSQFTPAVASLTGGEAEVVDSITSKSDGSVFSLKKMYSMPLYMSGDESSLSNPGYTLALRRMSTGINSKSKAKAEEKAKKNKLKQLKVKEEKLKEEKIREEKMRDEKMREDKIREEKLREERIREEKERLRLEEERKKKEAELEAKLEEQRRLMNAIASSEAIANLLTQLLKQQDASSSSSPSSLPSVTPLKSLRDQLQGNSNIQLTRQPEVLNTFINPPTSQIIVKQKLPLDKSNIIANSYANSAFEYTVDGVTTQAPNQENLAHLQALLSKLVQKQQQQQQHFHQQHQQQQIQVQQQQQQQHQGVSLISSPQDSSSPVIDQVNDHVQGESPVLTPYNPRIVSHESASLHEIDQGNLYGAGDHRSSSGSGHSSSSSPSSASQGASSSPNIIFYQAQDVTGEPVKANSPSLEYSNNNNGDLMESSSVQGSFDVSQNGDGQVASGSHYEQHQHNSDVMVPTTGSKSSLAYYPDTSSSISSYEFVPPSAKVSSSSLAGDSINNLANKKESNYSNYNEEQVERRIL